LEKVKQFEKELIGFMNRDHREIMDEIIDKKKLDDSLMEKISELIKQFKDGFAQL